MSIERLSSLFLFYSFGVVMFSFLFQCCCSYLLYFYFVIPVVVFLFVAVFFFLLFFVVFIVVVVVSVSNVNLNVVDVSIFCLFYLED